MGLSTRPKELIRNLYNQKKAIVAFNIIDIDTCLGILDASSELKVPVILQTSEKLIKYYGAKTIYKMVSVAMDSHKEEVLLHLDHCSNFDIIKECIDNGWNSIMFDGSHYSLNKNISLSNDFLSKTSNYQITTECEIGPILGEEDDVISMSNNQTSISDIIKFSEEVQPDMLAVGIGNKHGYYKPDEENININLLEQLTNIKKIPLVLHGGTGIPFPLIKQAIKFGATKINVSTALKQVFLNSCTKFSEINSLNYFDFKVDLRNSTKNEVINFINQTK